MSRVIGFRLDEDNPRERQALRVLAAWQESGFSTRHILTEALLQLEEGEGENDELPVREIVAALERVSEQLAGLQRGGLRADQGATAGEASLEDAFLRAVKQAAQSGLTLEE